MRIAAAVSSFFLVAEVDLLYRDLIKVQREVFDRVCAAMRPGTNAEELGEITTRPAEEPTPKSGPAAGCTAALTMHEAARVTTARS